MEALIPILTMFRGDAREIEATPTLDGVVWNPPDGTVVRATAKRNENDTDERAVWAKDNLGNGITFDGTAFIIELEPDDTSSLPTKCMTLVVDIQVADENDGYGPWTIAKFGLEIISDVTILAP